MTSRSILGITVLAAVVILHAPLFMNAALADSSGAYTDEAQPQTIPQESTPNTQQGSDGQPNPGWVEGQPGSPREISGLSPEENNKQLLNKAYQEKQAGLFRDGAAKDEPQGPPPDDVPTAGYKMFILDDKGNVKQTMTSQ